MRRCFVALAWNTEVAAAGDRIPDLSASIEADCAMRRVLAVPGLRVWTEEAAPLPIQRLLGGGVVLGDVSPMPGLDLSQSPLGPSAAGPSADPAGAVRRLSRAYWGQYVALSPGRSPGEVGVYRDPSGALDCMLWSYGDGIHIIASDMTRAPRHLRPRRQRLNWERIADLLAVPYAGMSTPLFDDITVVVPGHMVTVGDRPPRVTTIWSPGDFARPETSDLREVQAELVRRVDACTAAAIGRYDKVIVELSGGLDSSILAGAIGATGVAGRVGAWLNYHGARAEGDESRFARDVTDRLGVELHMARKACVPVDAAGLAELAGEFWPAMAGVDIGRDRHEVDLVRSTGAQAIVSGQGGDGVFFQYPTAMVAADEFHRSGLAALRSPVLADVARRTRQSVWGVLAQVREARRGAERRPQISSSLVSRSIKARSVQMAHPWVLEARERGLPPGKVMHVQGVAMTHLYNGRSRRRREADLVYPLFAQPVTELCLGIPVPDLAGGSYDRPFARNTFAHRLPASVVDRRSKGNLTAHFAGVVASSTETLRSFLLDGCLCEAGLLDRAELESHLDPQRLIWRGRPSDILWAAVTEAWVRYWQTQVPDSETAPRRLA